MGGFENVAGLGLGRWPCHDRTKSRGARSRFVLTNRHCPTTRHLHVVLSSQATCHMSSQQSLWLHLCPNPSTTHACTKTCLWPSHMHHEWPNPTGCTGFFFFLIVVSMQNQRPLYTRTNTLLRVLTDCRRNTSPAVAQATRVNGLVGSRTCVCVTGALFWRRKNDAERRQRTFAFISQIPLNSLTITCSGHAGSVE